MLPISGLKFLRRIESPCVELTYIFFENQGGYDDLRDADLGGRIVFFYFGVCTVHLLQFINQTNKCTAYVFCHQL